MRSAVQADLTVDASSSLYSPTLIDSTINRSYRKTAALFPWPEFQDALETTTENSNAYYDYPQNWRSNSIWKLRIDSQRYGEDPDGSPLSFDDYLNWKEDNPNSTDKKWANQERRYFITPTPADGLTLCVWGVKVVESLTDDGDTTKFSYSMPEGNEAIVLETVAILKSKGEEEKAGEFRSSEAKQILVGAWARIAKEQSKYEKNMPFFEVPNFFGGGNSRDMRGRFDI